MLRRQGEIGLRDRIRVHARRSALRIAAKRGSTLLARALAVLNFALATSSAIIAESPVARQQLANKAPEQDSLLVKWPFVDMTCRLISRPETEHWSKSSFSDSLTTVTPLATIWAAGRDVPRVGSERW
jgi:hypothetical protein